MRPTSSASTPTLYKTAAFMLSAVFVGMAGAIYASWVNYIEPPDVFDVLLRDQADGDGAARRAGTIFGPRSAPSFLLASRSWCGAISSTIHAAALGVIIVVLILFLPSGLSSLRARELAASP